MNKPPGNIDPSSFRRIARQTRAKEQDRRYQLSDRRSIPVNSTGGIMFLVTTALTPMSGATPGSGEGYIQKWAGLGQPYEDFNTTAYPIVNDTTATVAVGAYIACIPMYGYWHYVQVDKCSNLSGGS
jgi:hypothetical protein